MHYPVKHIISIKNIPFPVAVLLISFVIPIEASINIGSLFITPTRLILLMLVVPVFVRCISNRIFRNYDFLLFAYIAWTFIALTKNHTVSLAVENGGASALEILASYYLVVSYVKKVDHIRAIIKLFSVICFTLLPFLFFENITGVHLIHNIFENITGYQYPLSYEIRSGFTRAYGPFNHPILLGVFFSCMIGLLWYGSGRSLKRKLIRLTFFIFATLSSLSSAPYLMLVFQIFSIFWNKITSVFRHRWKFILFVIIFIYIVLLFISDRSPLMVILSRITLSPQTAYWRMYIFEYGAAEVLNNPYFGIGFKDWSRPFWLTSSVDNYWLLNAMRYGIPALIFLLIFITYIMRKVFVYSRLTVTGDLYMASIGWLVSMSALILGGFTVDYFGNNRPFFFFLLGLGGAILNMQKEALNNSMRKNHNNEILSTK